MLADPGDSRGTFTWSNSGVPWDTSDRTHTHAISATHKGTQIQRGVRPSSDVAAPPCSFISLVWLRDLKPLLSQCFSGSPQGVFTVGTPPSSSALSASSANT